MVNERDCCASCLLNKIKDFSRFNNNLRNTIYYSHIITQFVNFVCTLTLLVTSNYGIFQSYFTRNILYL